MVARLVRYGPVCGEDKMKRQYNFLIYRDVHQSLYPVSGVVSGVYTVTVAARRGPPRVAGLLPQPVVQARKHKRATLYKLPGA
jgi:hypothetical protein